MEVNPEWTKPIATITMAATGAALAELWRAQNSPIKKPFRFSRLLTNAALSAFIIYHLVSVFVDFGMSEKAAAASGALISVLGIEFLFFLVETLILKRLGLSYEQRVAKSLVEAGWTPPVAVRSLDIVQPESEFEGVKQGTSGVSG